MARCRLRLISFTLNILENMKIAKITGWVGLFSFFSSLVLAAVPVTSRPDSAFILQGDRAERVGQIHSWAIDLQHPGRYTVQVIYPLESGKEPLAGKLSINGQPASDELQKAYIIEEGLVAEFTDPVVMPESAVYTLSVGSEVAPKLVRLVPLGYTKSRIHLSSQHHYDAWLKMHQSAPKQAALEWYKDARFGMFIHWGVYSEAAGSWKGVPIEQGDGPKVAEWIQFAFKISREEYREFAKNFNPDRSFAANIAKLAKDTGMHYVVITSKHHDGFALFDSAHSEFDIADATPYDGDLIQELYEACRAEGLEFGVYYSHGNDWGEGGDGNYSQVKAYNDSFGVPTRPNGKNLWDPSPETHAEYLEKKAYPQIAELIRKLPDLRLIWFDGDGLITEQQAFDFYKLVYDLNPNIVVNRRVGYDFGDYIDAGDNKTPSESELAAKHFETCGTANHSWGFKAQDHDWKSSNQLLRNFVDIVSKGGNYLLNIGPDGQGRVPEPCVVSFREMGEWVETNREAIFGTRPWTTLSEGVNRVNDAESKPTEFWFSAKGDQVYAMSLAAPEGRVRILSLKQSAGAVTEVRLLGSDAGLSWNQTSDALEVDLSGIEMSPNGYALKVSMRKQAEDALTARPGYPEFSWDRMPLYMHIRKDKAYTEAEIQFLAKFPLITFEKSNGHKSFGSTEEGTLVAARQVKAINPLAKILYYRNVIVHYGGYAANKTLDQIPGALLEDDKGNRKLVRNRVAAYDLSNPRVRDWWIEQCKRMTEDPAIDGVFFDGNVKALEPGYLHREIGQDKKQAVEAGYLQMMQDTREAIGSDALMIANILRARFDEGGLEYLDFFDGSYLEGFFHNVGRMSYEDYVAKGIESMQQAARQGKIIAFTAGLAMADNVSAMGIDEAHGAVESDAKARQALIYTMAIFLICAEEYSYFFPHEGYSANGNDKWMRWFPEYDKPLGAPKGPAVKDGYRYTRSFEHATVFLDIQARTAEILWQH